VPDDTDPVIQQFRDKISDNDRALVEAVNARLRLVAQLKAYKESRGIDFVDPEREEWILRDLARANQGPLTADGLRAFYEEIFALTKREVAE
jgi:chorismate mutase/prephenate dehydratase